MTTTDDLQALLKQGYAYAYSLTHNPAHAEDLLHDAWLAILKIHGPQNKPYLFSAIRSRFLNQNKREKLVPVVNIDEVINETELQTLEKNEFELFADRDEINQALKCLRSIEREIIFLYYIEEFSTQEIADHTDLGKGTICSLIYRSRKKLLKLLSPSEVKVAK